MKKTTPVIIAVILYITIIIFTYFDKTFSYRWIIFTLWMLLIALTSSLLLNRKTSTKNVFHKIKMPDRYIIFIFVASIVILNLFLKSYPFHSIGDELRDGGLNAQQIVTGNTQNIFTWGRYDSHSLIIPTITSFFYLIFGRSVLTFRVPAMLLGFTTTIMTYIYCKRTYSQKTAFMASLILLSIPAFLFFSRTEVVVIFSSFWMLVILILLRAYLENQTYENLGASTLILGFASAFHASIRTVVLITLLFIFTIKVYQLIKKQIKFKQIVISALLGISTFFVGFGPRILFTTPAIAVKAPSFTHKYFSEIVHDYAKSLMGYFYEPLSFHTKFNEAILPFIFVIPLVIGIIYLYKKKKLYNFYLLLLVFILPFTNSALTDIVNADFRYGALYPIAAIITALGIEQISKLSIKKLYLYLINALFFLVCGFRIYGFFIDQKASKGMFRYDKNYYQEFMVTQLIYDMPKYSENINKICIYSTKNIKDYLELTHIQEQFLYYYPDTEIRLAVNTSVNDRQIIVNINCQNSVYPTIQKYCSKYRLFYCSPDMLEYEITYMLPIMIN